MKKNKKLSNTININLTFILSMLLMVILEIGLCYSFALFTSKAEKKGALNIVAGNLNSLIESNTFNEENQVTVEAGQTLELTIKLTNVNNQDAKFNLFIK